MGSFSILSTNRAVKRNNLSGAGIRTRAAGWKARMLPLCNAALHAIRPLTDVVWLFADEQFIKSAPQEGSIEEKKQIPNQWKFSFCLDRLLMFGRWNCTKKLSTSWGHCCFNVPDQLSQIDWNQTIRIKLRSSQLRGAPLSLFFAPRMAAFNKVGYTFYWILIWSKNHHLRSERRD